MQYSKWAVLFFYLSGAVKAHALELRPLEVELKQNFATYLQPLENHNDMESRTDLELKTGFTHRSFGLRFNPWLRLRSPYSQGGVDDRGHLNFELKEGWIENVEEDWEIRVGNQIFSWGASDWISPTDIWNGRDLVDPFAPVKLPLLAVKLSVHPRALENVVLEMIYAPQFRPHRFPVEIPKPGSNAHSFSTADSRWLIPLPNQVALSTDQTMPIDYEMHPAQFPEQWGAGARLRLINQRNWDFSLAAAQYVNPTPHFEITTQGSITSPSLPIVTALKAIYYRMNMLGADVAGTVNGFGLRLEAALLTPVAIREDEIPRRSLFVVAGVDHVLGRVYSAEFSANLAYIHKNREFEVAENPIFGLRELDPWSNSLAGQLEAQLHNRHYIGVRTIYELDSADAWIHPYVRTTTFDALQVEINGDFFAGNVKGFYGQYRDNERINALLIMNF